jgi:hypothetical protein
MHIYPYLATAVPPERWRLHLVLPHPYVFTEDWRTRTCAEPSSNPLEG